MGAVFDPDGLVKRIYTMRFYKGLTCQDVHTDDLQLFVKVLHNLFQQKHTIPRAPTTSISKVVRVSARGSNTTFSGGGTGALGNKHRFYSPKLLQALTSRTSIGRAHLVRRTHHFSEAEAGRRGTCQVRDRPILEAPDLRRYSPGRPFWAALLEAEGAF